MAAETVEPYELNTARSQLLRATLEFAFRRAPRVLKTRVLAPKLNGFRFHTAL
jgi:hypothetical protein